MNIQYVTRLYQQANQLKFEEKLLVAASTYFLAQKLAKQTRSAKRVDIWDYAHANASICAFRILENPESSHADRSEAGRIFKESGLLYRDGL